MSRDRDAAGRARNARPRDALGRPLARDATGIPPLAADQVLPPTETLQAAQRLLDADRPFDAHEVLEAAWKAAPPADQDLWQGLAQLAVGLTHARRGNARGAVALLRRGARRLEGYPDTGPHEVDVRGLRARSAELATRIEVAGLAGLSPDALSLRLCASAAGPTRPGSPA
ncbi:MAG TPA: DUF309 domain-containing protein [Streptosporangiaceae bacterium]|nr:DUF309 domain-containing protein [Streptosporangiaceae bacterium]